MKPSQNLLSWQVFVATAALEAFRRLRYCWTLICRKLRDFYRRLKQNLANRYSIRVIGPFNHPRAAELQRAVEPLVAGFQAALEPKAEPHERFTIRFAAPIELAQEYFSDKLFQYSELFHDIEFAVLPEVGPDDIRRGDVDVAVLKPSSRRSFRSDHSQLQQFDHGSISYAGISETARDAALAGGSQNARSFCLKPTTMTR